jgi:hypothetical protein
MTPSQCSVLSLASLLPQLCITMRRHWSAPGTLEKRFCSGIIT